MKQAKLDLDAIAKKNPKVNLDLVKESVQKIRDLHKAGGKRFGYELSFPHDRRMVMEADTLAEEK